MDLYLIRDESEPLALSWNSKGLFRFASLDMDYWTRSSRLVHGWQQK